MVTVITGTTTKPMSSEQLKNFFQSHLNLEGYLYIGYPIIGTVMVLFLLTLYGFLIKAGLSSLI